MVEVTHSSWSQVNGLNREMYIIIIVSALLGQNALFNGS